MLADIGVLLCAGTSWSSLWAVSLLPQQRIGFIASLSLASVALWSVLNANIFPPRSCAWFFAVRRVCSSLPSAACFFMLVILRCPRYVFSSILKVAHSYVSNFRGDAFRIHLNFSFQALLHLVCGGTASVLQMPPLIFSLLWVLLRGSTVTIGAGWVMLCHAVQNSVPIHAVVQIVYFSGVCHLRAVYSLRGSFLGTSTLVAALPTQPERRRLRSS